MRDCRRVPPTPESALDVQVAGANPNLPGNTLNGRRRFLPVVGFVHGLEAVLERLLLIQGRVGDAATVWQWQRRKPDHVARRCAEGNEMEACKQCTGKGLCPLAPTILLSAHVADIAENGSSNACERGPVPVLTVISGVGLDRVTG